MMIENVCVYEMQRRNEFVKWGIDMEIEIKKEIRLAPMQRCVNLILCNDDIACRLWVFRLATCASERIVIVVVVFRSA